MITYILDHIEQGNEVEAVGLNSRGISAPNLQSEFWITGTGETSAARSVSTRRQI
jgi:hypothetical protein